MQCATCGNDNLPQAQFCARCGTSLLDAVHVASTPATPAQPSSPLPSVQLERSPTVAAMEYAGFAVRLGAWFIDLLILVAIVLALSFWSVGVGIADSESALNTAVGFVILTLPWWYYWIFTSLHGQTPGKMVTDIMVVNEQGNIPGLGRAALRELLGKAISTVVLFVGFFWIIWDPRKQGWHDKLASTYVVRRRHLR